MAHDEWRTSRSSAKSPSLCIWIMMSHPPTNSPFTYTCGTVGHSLSQHSQLHSIGTSPVTSHSLGLGLGLGLALCLLTPPVNILRYVSHNDVSHNDSLLHHVCHTDSPHVCHTDSPHVCHTDSPSLSLNLCMALSVLHSVSSVDSLARTLTLWLTICPHTSHSLPIRLSSGWQDGAQAGLHSYELMKRWRSYMAG